MKTAEYARQCLRIETDLTYEAAFKKTEKAIDDAIESQENTCDVQFDTVDQAVYMANRVKELGYTLLGFRGGSGLGFTISW